MRLFAGTKFDQPPKCDHCGQPAAECVCPNSAGPGSATIRAAATSQPARLSLEKRKKGKHVTVIRGLSPQLNDLPGLLSQLKSRCGAGGTIQDETLEIQGDQREKI